MPVDPTMTTTIRQRYILDVVRRFRALRSLISKSVIDRDVFGFETGESVAFVGDALPRRQAFAFTRPESRQQAFGLWIDQQISDGILSIPTTGPNWQRRYIDSAYRAGIRQSLRSVGQPSGPVAVSTAFLSPVHVERTRLIYTRNLDALRGITRTMAEQISSTLATGITEGRGPRELARLINNRVDKIGITRARTMARTETISAHAEATLTTFEELGVNGVQNEAEFSTSGDDLVCPVCEEMEEQTFTIESARGVIPVHPNCRCRWLPVIADPGVMS